MKTTTLYLEGIEPDQITEEFLIAIMDAADEAELPLESVSISRNQE